MMGILHSLGCPCWMEEDSLLIQAKTIERTQIPDALAGKMRSSVMLLGPLLARCGQASTSLPGGCRIGKRPVDLHLAGLEQLGARVQTEEDQILATVCEAGLCGAQIHLPYPSVGATENILMAAVGAKGETILTGAAREPEIEILCSFFEQLGVKVRGAGTSRICIEGTKTFENPVFSLPGDRIVAGTYLGAVMHAGGQVFLERAPAEHMETTVEMARRMGARIECRKQGIWVSMKERAKAASFQTGPYPEFPTDMQSVMMAVAAGADGISRIRENVFENRFSMAKELQKLGAHIIIENNLAQITGSARLLGTTVVAEDLRGGAALVVACLGAEGESQVLGYEHISRGYEDISRDLSGVGARIELVSFQSESSFGFPGKT